MLTALHIRASARSLVKQYGDGAWVRVARHTEALAEAGDWKGVAMWRRIGGAIHAFEARSATH